MSQKSKYPIAIFELVSHQGSGFIREDTLRSNNPIEIRHPKNRSIVNRSFVKKEWKDDATGDVTFENVPTRYVYNEKEILVNKQEERRVASNPKTDKIVFINGFITVPKSGATIGLYNFLQTHALNESNPERPDHLAPIFKEVKPAENAAERSFNEFEQSDAVAYIRQFVSEQGGKYIYQDDRIDALALQFNIAAGSTEEKVEGLIYYAKANPKFFLSEAKKAEQIVLIEIKHALKLKVIAFEGNTCLNVKKNQKIKSFVGNLTTDEKKANALANYFQSVDGRESYELFKAELNAAKEGI